MSEIISALVKNKWKILTAATALFTGLLLFDCILFINLMGSGLAEIIVFPFVKGIILPVEITDFKSASFLYLALWQMIIYSLCNSLFTVGYEKGIKVLPMWLIAPVCAVCGILFIRNEGDHAAQIIFCLLVIFALITTIVYIWRLLRREWMT